MGRNKALLTAGGVAWGRRVAEVLDAAGCAPVVAIGGDPIELASLGVPVLADETPGLGPLAGVVTALGWVAASSPEGMRRTVVVAACDLPRLTPVAVRRLLDAAEPGIDVVVAHTDRPEPLLAVWSTSALGTLRERLAAGRGAVHEAIAALVGLGVDVDPDALRNINTPAELRRYADEP